MYNIANSCLGAVHKRFLIPLPLCHQTYTFDKPPLEKNGKNSKNRAQLVHDLGKNLADLCIRLKIVDVHNWETLSLPLVYNRIQFEQNPHP